MMPVQTRTVLRALLEAPDLNCANWSSFRVAWSVIAAEAARILQTPRLAKMTISQSTHKRWLNGSAVARGDARTILEFWLGFGVERLRQLVPVRELVSSRPLDRRTKSAARAIDCAWPTSRLVAAELESGIDGNWHFSGGLIFDGTSVGVHLYEARPSDGHAEICEQDLRHLQQFARSSRRGLLVASLAAAGGQGLYVMDSGHARALFSSSRLPDPLRVPLAYRLDDLTYALVWALHVLDDGLLADDSVLAEHEPELRHYLNIGRSAPARSLMPDLSPIGAAWLGSNLCARYIVHHLQEVHEVPQFWTRERTGEEAAPWLFFRHKHDYLRTVSDRFAGTHAALGRAFCIPESAVARSEPYERILLFLAIAMMEMNGLRVWVCTEADYDQVEGFVLGPGHAIVANWVREQAVWRVGTTASRRDISPYEEAMGHARAHSIIDAPTPVLRLRALAEYLSLDWTWLTSRSGELAATGMANMLKPRSRLLTLAALNRTLHFLGASKAA